ncbi:MAG: hypothetical protein PHS82_06275 [Lachnospiraceae bacterium]|nr:hypothetical protein [Lachnospiraceae bacterium]
MNYYRYFHVVNEDALFLTKKACKEHIEKYGYNYKQPHTYVMTACQCPEYEKLLEVIKNTDWSVEKMSKYMELPWSHRRTIENLKEIKEHMQEKVIIQNLHGRGKKDAEEVEFDFDRAINALEKQIPKKPIERNYEEPGEKPYIKHTCPAGCKITLHGVEYGQKYCQKCGQRLDWSEE